MPVTGAMNLLVALVAAVPVVRLLLLVLVLVLLVLVPVAPPVPLSISLARRSARASCAGVYCRVSSGVVYSVSSYVSLTPKRASFTANWSKLPGL